MLKLIVKNLWARRRRNGWLLAELILVGIVAWIILDPVIVLTHDRNIPHGYDTDRLCVVSLDVLSVKAPDYDKQASDSATMVDAYLNLVRRVQDFPGVELATPLWGFCYPNSRGSSFSGIRVEGDTLDLYVVHMSFLPHSRFFETYGFAPGEGRTPEELSDYNYTQNDVVLSENAASYLFHTKRAQNRHCVSVSQRDTTYMPVIGTVGTFKMFSDWGVVPVMFHPVLSINAGDIPNNARILIRLREDVSIPNFLHKFHPWMVKELRGGNLFARNVQSYDELIVRHESTATQIYRRNLAMAIFFLINLGLGVIGTFWLQTRTRREEVGIMLSFGATPRYIINLLMGEGAILTLISSVISSVIYLQYALKEGFYQGLTGTNVTEQYWTMDFTQHFLIVSGILFFILLVVVLAGIYIPARNISRIPPTEALRDE